MNTRHGHRIAWIWACIAVIGCERAEPVERVLEWPTYETTAAEVEATYERAISRAEQRLAKIVAQSPAGVTLESTLGALDRMKHELAKGWNRLNLLKNVSPDPAVRAAASEKTVTFSQWFLDNVTLNRELYEIIEAFSETPAAQRLRGADRRLMELTLEEYRRAGMELSEEDRATLREWQARLTELTNQILMNINEAEGLVAFEPGELEGLSEEQLQQLEHDEAAGRYQVRTAIRSQFDLVMENAVQADTRRRALVARLTRAMEDNAELIREVVELRARIADILGYETWADYRIEPRMAETPEAARGFLRTISERLAPKFRAEQIQLRDLMREHLDDPDIEVADLGLEDIALYANMLREREYAVDTERVRQYFAEGPTLRRIFDLYEQVLGLDITVREPEVREPERAWADDVQVAVVADARTGRVLGAFYLDLHPRPGKFTHFASFSIVDGRQLSPDRYQAPINAIVGNWPTAAGDRPSLWTFDNVRTMLHEVGHALHDVLTEAEYYQLAGTEVPRDFVETPSQTLERWLEEPAVIRRLAEHYRTGEEIPDDLVASLIEVDDATIGHWYRRQLGFGLLDFRIHTYTDVGEVPETAEDIYGVTNEIFGEQYYPVPDDTATLASFGHLFGGYDAGYYSYAWSDAISADIASRFEATPRGFMNPELGARLREEILEVGNIRPPAESVRAFLGRDWTTEAFFDELLDQE